MVYNHVMILSFRHKGLQFLFEHDSRSKVPAQDAQKLKRILLILNRAAKPEDMRLPGFRLHPLKGKLKGFWGVTVTANWRVIFRFENGHTYDVDLTDYH